MGEPFGSKEIILNEEEGRVNRHGRPPEPQKLTLSCPLAGSAGRGWHEETSTAPLSFSEGLPAQGLGSTLQVYPPPQLPSVSQTRDPWDVPFAGLALTLNSKPFEPGVGGGRSESHPLL